MFTGIIESTARVCGIEKEGSNVHFILECPIANEFKVDQSVAHSGVCLTVVAIDGFRYRVTAVAETLAKTTLGSWGEGSEINIERSLRLGDRLDGHFVQGHVDTVGTCTERQELSGSWLFRFQFPEQFAALVIEKGSICLNGVSLTIFDVSHDQFSVAIIPYTYTHTNIHTLVPGAMVNLEFDVMGKYLLRRASLG